MGNELYVLEGVSCSRDGVTVGQLQKLHSNLTVGQVGRMLTRLCESGLVYMTVEPYGRTGKKVYRITEFCAVMCAGIARNYTEQ